MYMSVYVCVCIYTLFCIYRRTHKRARTHTNTNTHVYIGSVSGHVRRDWKAFRCRHARYVCVCVCVGVRFGVWTLRGVCVCVYLSVCAKRVCGRVHVYMGTYDA